MKSAIAEILKNGSDWTWWRDRMVDYILPWIHKPFPPASKTVDIHERDWDVLIVLDGCRSDLFEEAIDVDHFDSYERVLSPVGTTPEWLAETFPGEYGDTVYVSANPQVSKADGLFHENCEVWDESAAPEAVYDCALEKAEDYPDKKLVVHFMQPHIPFFPAMDEYSVDPWTAVEEGIFSREKVWADYRENLEYALEYAHDLANEVDGRVVITSDHGNLFGEKLWPLPVGGKYGHPKGVRHPSMLSVPWVVIEGDTRRPIEDDGVNLNRSDLDTVEERLKGFGYKG